MAASSSARSSLADCASAFRLAARSATASTTQHAFLQIILHRFFAQPDLEQCAVESRASYDSALSAVHRHPGAAFRQVIEQADVARFHLIYGRQYLVLLV